MDNFVKLEGAYGFMMHNYGYGIIVTIALCLIFSILFRRINLNERLRGSEIKKSTTKITLAQRLKFELFWLAFILSAVLVDLFFINVRLNMPETAALLDSIEILLRPLIFVLPIAGVFLVWLDIRKEIMSPKKLFVVLGVMFVIFMVVGGLHSYSCIFNPLKPSGYTCNLFSAGFSPITDVNTYFIQNSIFLLAFLILFFGIILLIMLEVDKHIPKSQKKELTWKSLFKRSKS